MRIPVSVLTSVGLLGGYGVAAGSGSRAAGGVVLFAVGAWAGWESMRRTDTRRAAAVVATYLVAFGASHGLALLIGAWPAVVVVAAITAAVALGLVDRATPTVAARS